MNNFRMFFKHWDRVNDITLRLVKQMPEDKLDLKPTEKNFTFKELVTHIYHAEKVFADSCKSGEVGIEDFDKNPPPEIKTLDELYNYGKEVHENTNKIISQLTDDELISKVVKAPWGNMPVFHHMNGAYEHLWHHRGQMYIYLRMAGVEDPVNVFDYSGMPEPV